MTTVVCLGASITAGAHGTVGWVARVRARSDDETLVYGLGVSGEASDEIASRFDREVPPRTGEVDPAEPVAVLLQLGTNDARVEPDGRVNAPAAFADNLRAVRERAHEVADVVRVLDVLPSDERVDPAPWHPDHRWPAGDLATYDERLRGVVPPEEVIPVRERFVGHTRDLLADGLHPNAAGHRVIADRVVGALDAAGVGAWAPARDR